MKRILILITVLLTYSITDVYSQDDSNLKFFNITKFHQFKGTRNIVYSANEIFNYQNKSSLLEYNIETINGVYLNKFISLGIGVGLINSKFNMFYIEHKESKNKIFKSYPIFLDIRAYLFDKPNSPFTYFEIGKNYDFEDKFLEGKVINFGLGYKLRFTDKINLVSSFSYNFKEFDYNTGLERKDGVAFNIGILF